MDLAGRQMGFAMRNWILFVNSIFFSCLGLSAWAAETPQPATAPDATIPDVRMIIDISGSMKKTDPTNLRRPAVDLMVRLIPDGSKAGIWTFGEQVNLLMPYRSVDESWRQQAAATAPSINSVAKYTNIGAALEKATDASMVLDKNYRHHLILLTDGVVDIGPEAVGNMNERKRILTELLPRLKEAGYIIHTIALSDAADQELMKKLSQSTDGVFVVARTADDLMNTFLKIFDQAIPAERVPLDENGFLVDASIQEFTALIFRKADVPATVIAAPDGTEYSGTDPANNVNWYRTDKYDLITVQQPKAGQWKIKTEMAPNSRVTVVSNLQLIVTPLKTNVRRTQPISLEYSFAENKEIVTKTEFLELLSAQAVTAKDEDPQSQVIELTPETVPADGVFRHQLPGFADVGDYSIRVNIDGKTFKREFVHRLQVSDSLFKLEKHQELQEGKPTYSYKLMADPEAVDIAATQIAVTIKSSQGNNLEKALNIIGNDHWEFSFSPVQVAKYTVTLTAKGRAVDGSPLEEVINADEFFHPDEASVLKAETPAEAPVSSEPAETPEPQPEEENVEEQPNQLWLYVGIGVANLLVLVLGFFAYKMIMGGKANRDLDDIEKSLNVDVNELTKQGDKKKNKNTVIDVSEEDKMKDMSMSDLSVSPDDQMAENLFPLDTLEDPKDKR